MSLDGFNASALLSELRQSSKDARLQKFSQLTEDDFLLHLRSPGRTDRLIISLHPERSRFHLLLSGHPPAIVPSSFVMLCRKHLGGTWLESMEQRDLDRVIELRFGSGFSLIFDWAGRPSHLLLIKTEERTVMGVFPAKGRFRLRAPYGDEVRDKPSALSLHSDQIWDAFQSREPKTLLLEALDQVAYDWAPLWKRRLAKLARAKTLAELPKEALDQALQSILEPLRRALETDSTTHFKAGLASDGELSYCLEEAGFPSMQEAANARWLDSNLAPGVSDFRSELLKKLKKNREKSARKLSKRQNDKKGAESAPMDQLKGDLLLAYAIGLRRGEQEFQTKDWEGRPMSIALDPSLGVTDNAERYYNRAKKKRRALKVLEEQIELARVEIEIWDELIFAAESSENRTDLEQVRKCLPTGQGKKRKKAPEVPSSGPRRFRHHNFLILVGRNPSQNEKLSLKTAAKDDHWFHVRQGAGSHVLIRTAGAEPPAATVEAAAWLAAKYSQSAASTAVEIVTTRARFLKKPKGGHLGKVIYRQETEIVVNPSSAPPEGLSEQRKNGPEE